MFKLLLVELCCRIYCGGSAEAAGRNMPDAEAVVLADGLAGREKLRKGANGVATNGVGANFMLFDRGTFWAFPLTCVLLSSHQCQGEPFSQAVKFVYFCSGPISVDLVSPQPRSVESKVEPASGRRTVISLGSSEDGDDDRARAVL